RSRSGSSPHSPPGRGTARADLQAIRGRQPCTSSILLALFKAGAVPARGEQRVPSGDSFSRSGEIARGYRSDGYLHSPMSAPLLTSFFLIHHIGATNRRATRGQAAAASVHRRTGADG